MELTLTPVTLPLRHRFTIAHGSAAEQQSLLVALVDQGVTGYGEGPASEYYAVSVAQMVEALERARPQIESAPWTDPSALWDRLLPLLGHDRFALCAVDEAAHDLWGKQQGRSVHASWGLHQVGFPLSDYTIGIDTVDKMLAKMKEFDGWPIYKIKLGTPDDLKIVRSLRQHTNAVFRVDANCAWTVDQALKQIAELGELGVEFVEQPLPPEDWEGMRRVYAKSVLPVIADESCRVETDVDRCHGHFHGVNIKLCKAGGMTPARRMIARARQLGLKVMAGCMTESTVGISAVAQFLPLLDYADMDGALLLGEDVATGVSFEHGRAVFPRVNGNGVRLL